MTVRREMMPRAAAVVAVAALATIAGPTAAHADKTGPGDSASVGIGVEIEALGELYMEVAPGAITLVEEDSGADARRFEGNLPEVSVVDTRTPAEVAVGVSWYVLGTASDFVSPAGDVIPAASVGWAPEVVDNQGQANVVPGEEVDGDYAGAGPGLVSTELLFWDLGPVVGDPHVGAGVFTATALVSLSTPVDVASGQYEGTLTLSLFED